MMRVYRADERKWVDLPEVLVNHMAGDFVRIDPGQAPCMGMFPQGEVRIKSCPVISDVNMHEAGLSCWSTNMWVDLCQRLRGVGESSANWHGAAQRA